MTASSAAPSVVSAPIREQVSHAAEPRSLLYAAAVFYAVVVAVTILRHEPWADEAQAWLLARDSSLVTLWTQLLHYEGSPGLWQTLLHFLVKLGVPYAAYNFVSGLLGFTAAWLCLRHAPLPLPIRLLVPFTYFIAYQYSVVARSYALIAPLLFLIALIYLRAHERPVLFTALVCLIAAISVHGMILSGCLWLAVGPSGVFERGDSGLSVRRRWFWATAVYAVVGGLLMWSAWPAKDVAFAEGRGLPNLVFQRFVDVAQIQLSQAFTGEWISSLAIVALSLPFLWKGGGARIFLPASVLLWLFGAVVYSKEWHYGIVFLTWLFAMWVSAARIKLTRAALAALVAVIAVQCYWTIAALAYDWQHAYSGSGEAARYVQAEHLKDLYAVGYPTTALQPYFPANLYSDSQHAYWDWSKRNPANPENDPAAIFSARRRDMVLVGYRRPYERSYWKHVMETLGYRLTRHFDGNLFWHARVLEPEAFDLYRRTPGTVPPGATSALNLGAAGSESQLLGGFYAVEDNAWRWTAKRFSALLRTPPFAARSGARLTLQFYLPDAQVEQLGPMTLSGDVDGYSLAGQTYSKAGRYLYSAAVPREALDSDLVAVNLRFDKAAIGVHGDSRQLAVVASSIALTTE